MLRQPAAIAVSAAMRSRRTNGKRRMPWRSRRQMVWCGKRGRRNHGRLRCCSCTSCRRRTITVRDLRTVMVLRRQLVQEQHRNRPWFRLPRFPHQTIWRRDLHGILRFPLVRLLRMAALTAIAAGCLNIAYHDTAPAAVLAGLALYLVGLDAVEPLAQEIDQA